MNAAQPRPRNGVTFAVLAAAVSAFALMQSLIIPVLSRIEAEFETDTATTSWVLTGYLLAASVATPILGRLGDAIGKQKVLVVSIGLLTFGSAMATFAGDIGWLIVARVVAGAGAGVMPLAFGIIRDEFPAARRQHAISSVASLSAVGFGVGIVVGGPIVDVLGFRALFWLPAVLTAVVAVAAAVFIPESPVRQPGRLPLLPAALLSGALVAVLLAVSRGNAWGWLSVEVVALVGLGILLAGAWVWSEHRAAVPLIDLHLMRRRAVWTTNVVSGAVGFGVFAAVAFTPQFFQTSTESGYGFGLSIAQSGWLLLPYCIVSFLVGSQSARLIARWGARNVITSGCGLIALAFALMAGLHGEPWQFAVAFCIQGLGAGMVFSSLANVLVATVPAEQTGVANGMNFNIRTIGGAIGTAVLTGVITSHHGSLGYPAERGYTLGYLVLTGVMVVAATLAWRIPDLRSEHAADRTRLVAERRRP